MNGFIGKHISTIIGVVATAGIATTVVLTAKAAPKAARLIEEAKKEKEKEKLTKVETIAAAAPAYIPAVISGVMTSACIFGAIMLGKKVQASTNSEFGIVNFKKEEKTMKKPKFEFGEVMCSRNVKEKTENDVEFCTFANDCLNKHIHGDWGDLGSKSVEKNEKALVHGGRLFSLYAYKPTGEELVIATEADRSETTLVLWDKS